MRNTIGKLCVIFATLILLFSVAFFTVSLILKDGDYFEQLYKEKNVSEQTGIGTPDLSRATDALLRYMRGERANIRIDVRKDGEEVQRVPEAVVVECSGDVLAKADRQVIRGQDQPPAKELPDERPHVPPRVEERRVVLTDAVDLPDQAFAAHKKAGKTAGHRHQKEQRKKCGGSCEPPA